MRRTSSQRGFTLLEMVLYLALLVSLATLTTLTLLAVGKSYASLKAAQRQNSSAIAAIGRIGAEIRAAESVNLAGSTLGTSPGTLSLSGGSGATTTEFFLSGSSLHVRRNGADGGALTDAKTNVSALTFYLADNGTSQGVRTSMTLTTTEGSSIQTETFHSFFILRSSY
jgi:type II secretory pathway component PulJ